MSNLVQTLPPLPKKLPKRVFRVARKDGSFIQDYTVERYAKACWEKHGGPNGHARIFATHTEWVEVVAL